MKNKAKWSVGIVLAILILIGVMGYKAGYRLTDDFTIGKLGIVNITTPLDNISIIIDQKKKFVSDQKIDTFILSPGHHEIIISKNGYFPWIKKFKLPSDETVNFSPMYVTQNATGEIITQKDPQYWKLQDLVAKATLPTKEKPRVFQDGTVKVWVENNIILADVNGEIHTVLDPQVPIKNLDFYKNRSDIIMFSAGNAVYAVEIESKNMQNIMPIFKGIDPHFVETDPSFIYVSDGSTLMEVVI